MNRLKLFFATCCLLTVGSVLFTACSNDEGSEGNFPKELIGAWDVYGSTITFRDNGTGEIATSDYEDEDDSEEYSANSLSTLLAKTRADQNTVTIPFTWSYKAEGKCIFIVAQGHTIKWRISSLSTDVLIVIDDEGEEIGMRKSTGSKPDNPDDNDGYEIGPKELLYGAWGAAGRKMIEFGKNGMCGLYNDDGCDIYPYQYNEETHVISISDDEGLGDVPVKVLTSNVICLDIRTEGGSIFFSRIKDDDRNTVGPLSLIYDKKLIWMGMGAPTGQPLRVAPAMTIKANGQILMTAINGMSYTYNYKYNEHTHQMTMLVMGQEADTWTVIKLTDNAIVVCEEGQDEIKEYRAM